MNTHPDRLLITAASARYGPSLLALLGSLSLNWPGHPPVLVYDIGLDTKTQRALERHGVTVKHVPAFCPHWRQHYTWKIWCWDDAPARHVLWIDAGISVLQPLDEIFDVISDQGYFVVSNGMPLSVEASEAACRGCGVEPAFRENRETLTAAVVGYDRQGPMNELLAEAMRVALVEEYIAATTPEHRWEQAIFSLLMYRRFGEVRRADAALYHGDRSPRQTPAPKIWLHRRGLRWRDRRHFIAHIGAAGAPHLPAAPAAWRSHLGLWRIRRWIGARFPALMYKGVHR
ncbi:MAG: hypothetical protein ACKV2V_18995 [Blastocatellia bacterium]